jgi:hypothetical protein
MSEQRISRTARGKRPVYFEDPAVDKLMSMLLAVVGELSVTRDRLDALERLLEDKSVLTRAEIDDIRFDDDVVTERDERRAEYLARVMRIVTMELQRADETGATESFTSTLQQMLDDDDPPATS